MTTIALLPGDGIGSEILDGPLTCLRRLQADGAPITLSGPFPYGTTGWRTTGSILPPETVAGCREADVVLSGAVGTYPGVTAAECPNPEAALIELRHLFDLRISIRTVWVPGDGDGGEDVVIVRNITGGAYASPDRRQEPDGVRPAEDRVVLEPDRVREVFAIAAEYAARRPDRRAISVDKASVFATSRLWRRTAHESGTARADVDRAAYELVKYPELPGLIVTEGITALFEPADGTAPHRQPPFQPHRRLAGPDRPARLVPGSPAPGPGPQGARGSGDRRHRGLAHLRPRAGRRHRGVRHGPVQQASARRPGMTVTTATFQPSEAVRRIERTSLRTAQPASRAGLISLAIGEPDFATPPHVRAAAAQAPADGHTHYTNPQGDPELRAALAAAILAIVNPGDRVVLPDPTYSLYSDLVQLAGGECVFVPLRADLFVFCNPSNPTGATLVLADEAYSELVHTAEPFVSALHVPGLAGRTLYCQTFSKSYAMTGWRLGYLTGPRDVVSAAARVHATVNGSVNSAVQRAALTALSTADADIRRMRQAYGARRGRGICGCRTPRDIVEGVRRLGRGRPR
ncbi:aminotransferase class I/II-fold pyridoxal phosphate-dependent enzyme [Streptomyces sp. S3(2020)]|uniref:aminotransferase class I/II-fold pyridoxal phosphate-dependent enzyme n=1 Tax=Streptomyces sp. S3(2020) TaxID=2732044 RepID=UPI001488B7F0|nr:aminotransferase class I/II-fold pyridoxal phosphate-dependent enzyme [Streptomyces sp. S3(2020)]NNN29391.1 aminotransferase class I/II-fold pyridoxal phosphate-dependent enzyme [Streptomyces sp. S3(2020)]